MSRLGKGNFEFCHCLLCGAKKFIIFAEQRDGIELGWFRGRCRASSRFGTQNPRALRRGVSPEKADQGDDEMGSRAYRIRVSLRREG